MARTLPLWSVMIGSGIMGAFAFAPFFMRPLFFVSTFVLARHLFVGTCSPFRLGWYYGCGLYVALLWWVGNAVLIDARHFGWLWPFATFALPSCLALFMGTAAWITHTMYHRCKGHEWMFVFVFGCAFSACEWVQGLVFPWVPAAAIWVNCPVDQMVAFIGVHGLGWVTWMLASLCVVFVPKQPRWTTARIMPLIVWCIVICSMWAIGVHRLNTYPTTYHDQWVVRLVQPATSMVQRMKPDFVWRHGRHHFNRLIDLSNQNTSVKPTCIVWPEGSFPFSMSDTCRTLSLPLTPVVWQSTFYCKSFMYNGLMASDHCGHVQHIYSKNRLLPFGEYIPGRNWVRNTVLDRMLKKITPGDQDFCPGTHSNTLVVHGCPSFIGLICYESIFSSTHRRYTNPSAQWILNPTNDGWFGTSSGPYQHLSLTRLRAIECGLPVIRPAHSGISAVIDPLGRIIHHTALNVPAIIDTAVPCAVPITPFARYKKWLATLLASIMMCIGCIVYIKGKK